QDAEQGRLAGAVGADQGQQLAGAHVEVDPRQDRPAVEVDADAAGLGGAGPGGRADHGAQGAAEPHAHPPCRARVRRSSDRNTGAPISAVRTPRGISAGAAIVRAARSPATSTTAPASALAGTRTRWPGPAMSRMRCGTSRG